MGRTLVAAVDLLSRGQVVATDNGIHLYNPDGSELVAVYDSASQTAGDTRGTPNASPEQMAAIIASWEHVGRAEPQAASTAVRSLLSDLDALRTGNGSPLAVADSAYLVMREHLSGGAFLTLGAQVNTPRCPDCGRWMGDIHNCPVRARNSEDPGQADATSQTAVLVPLVPAVPAVPTVPPPPDAETPAPSDGAAGAARAPEATGASTSADQAPPAVPKTPAETLADAFDRLSDRLGDKLGERLGTVLGRTLGEKLGDSLLTRPSGAQPAKYADGLPLRSEPPSPTDERMATALDRLATVLQEWSSRGAAGDPASVTEIPTSKRRTPARTSESNAPSISATSPARSSSLAPPTPPARLPLEALPLTPQEHILKHVKPPEPPDPYLSRLDASLGGQRAEPLPLHYEEIDPSYDVGASAERALRIVSSSLQIAWDPNRKKGPHSGPRGTHMRVFGFAGTAGTGKNTTARQIAASLGLPYYETTLHRDTSLQEEIGQTVLHDGTSLPKLGPLGQAAAAGGVICINELVKANPGTLGALQRMMEDGVFEVQGTEAGMAAKEIPVHPSTVFICTWNPGYDGSSDRPDAALLSRIPTIRMDAPDVKDETRRLLGSLEVLFGSGEGGGDESENAEGAPGTSGGRVNDGASGAAARQKQERRQEILGRDYAIARKAPSPERVEIAVRFVRDLRNLAQTRQIGASSRHLLEPTPREALHFAAMCEATGDPLLALEQFKIYCDSGEGYDEQFKLIQQIFKRYYGEDGQALNRRVSGNGPQAS